MNDISDLSIETTDQTVYIDLLDDINYIFYIDDPPYINLDIAGNILEF